MGIGPTAVSSLLVTMYPLPVRVLGAKAKQPDVRFLSKGPQTGQIAKRSLCSSGQWAYGVMNEFRFDGFKY